ncbi:MAG: hypothetical protein C3F02_04740 [Parcubacteria group bacterium]|nr:MAG: hypothetical protein C3F02_04740 [Parcubacteria group bacterium]
MKTEKIFIKNRGNKKIAVLLNIVEDAKGLVFIMHGLGGFKEQKHIAAVARAFNENNFNVVRFDTTHTLGQSEGSYEDANITNYYEDLEDVINWADQQKWFVKPFALVGHSLGGFCVSYYAEKYPDNVSMLAPLGTVLAGRLTIEARDHKEVAEWRRTGYQVRPSSSKPGVIKKLKWNQYEADTVKYDLRPKLSVIKIPTLFVLGENDFLTENNRIYFDALSGKKEWHIVKGADHTFKRDHEIEELYQIVFRWIKCNL